MRKLMVERAHPQLSLRRQSGLLGINRNRLNPLRPGPLNVRDQVIARRIDELALEYPEFGARRMSRVVSREGMPLSRKRAGRIMKAMGLESVYRRPRTSKPGRLGLEAVDLCVSPGSSSGPWTESEVVLRLHKEFIQRLEPPGGAD